MSQFLCNFLIQISNKLIMHLYFLINKSFSLNQRTIESDRIIISMPHYAFRLVCLNHLFWYYNQTRLSEPSVLVQFYTLLST